MLRRLVARLIDRVPGRLAAHARPGSRVARNLGPAINRLLPRGPRLVTVRSGAGAGLRLLIDPQSEKYYWTGMHEPHVQDAVVRSLRQGGVFWDVGAHIGLMTLLAARVVGEEGSVMAFEPMPGTRERLRASVAANHVANVTVEPVALTNASGSQLLHSAEASLMWTLSPDRGERDGVLVTCSTLDAYHASHPHPDLIKIDAEGIEVEVLRGGLGLIAAHHPLLLIEFSSEPLFDEGRMLLGESYEWNHLGDNHWLLTPALDAVTDRS